MSVTLVLRELSHILILVFSFYFMQKTGHFFLYYFEYYFEYYFLNVIENDPTYIKVLRYSSLGSNVLNMFVKFQVCVVHNKRYLLKKKKVKQIFF